MFSFGARKKTFLMDVSVIALTSPLAVSRRFLQVQGVLKKCSLALFSFTSVLFVF